jgi:hypothetical protein
MPGASIDGFAAIDGRASIDGCASLRPRAPDLRVSGSPSIIVA